MVPEEKLLEIEIEPGMRDGQEYPFIAEGTMYNLKLHYVTHCGLFGAYVTAAWKTYDQINSTLYWGMTCLTHAFLVMNLLVCGLF